MRFPFLFLSLLCTAIYCADDEFSLMEYARGKLPPEVKFNKGFTMMEFNDLLIMGIEAKHNEGINGIDIQTGENDGYILGATGIVIMITKKDDIQNELKKTVKGKDVKISEYKWKINDKEYSVMAFGNNDKMVTQI